MPMQIDWQVYVLDLEGGKKYVGRTDKGRLARRIKSHVQGKGAAWTRRYRPLTNEPLEVRTLERGAEGGLEEDVVVKKYMLNYGVGNVRGGSYSQVSRNLNGHIEGGIAYQRPEV